MESSEAQPVGRIVLALYDSKEVGDIANTPIHQFAEMPLNHIGAIVEYHDLQTGFPSLDERNDVIGILIWQHPNVSLNQAEDFSDWALKVIKAGKRVVLVNALKYLPRNANTDALIDLLMQELGIEGESHEIHLIDGIYKISYPAYGRPFERSKEAITENFFGFYPNGLHLNPHMIAIAPQRDPLIIAATSQKGGFITQGAALFLNPEIGGEDYREWRINPFSFFREAYGLKGIPIPDTTTLAGQRIYYSHIDGDGWNNITEVFPYTRDKALSADVLMHEIFLKYPDLPVTMGLITADVALDWQGTEKSQEAAKKILQLPNVETACHTYSHPFYWDFFDHYQPEMEVPFLSTYPPPVWKVPGFFGRFKQWYWFYAGAKEDRQYQVRKDLKRIGYTLPRAFASYQYTTQREVVDAVELINTLAPPEKPVALYLWSGNCRPYEEIIHLTRTQNIYNMNGGDTRFDFLFPSYAWVKPISRQVGNERQIYSSSSNENTYTELWTTNFFAFSSYRQTAENTETPWRVKPINLYYHTYSGEKIASLQAIHEILDWIRTLEITPIKASEYAAIVEGFFSAKIFAKDDLRWIIKDRGALQTIRFDHASGLKVDFENSIGVIGEALFQGSLYVYLDRAVQEPEVALRRNPRPDPLLPRNSFCLKGSRWQVWAMEQTPRGISCNVQGFGPLKMVWNIPEDGDYQLKWISSSGEAQETTVSSYSGLLQFNWDIDGLVGGQLKIERVP